MNVQTQSYNTLVKGEFFKHFNDDRNRVPILVLIEEIRKFQTATYFDRICISKSGNGSLLAELMGYVKKTQKI